MARHIPTVRLHWVDTSGHHIEWVPRDVILLHLDRITDRDWIPATYWERRRGRARCLTGLIARRDIQDGPERPTDDSHIGRRTPR
jgi:hypothetical protein